MKFKRIEIKTEDGYVFATVLPKDCEVNEGDVLKIEVIDGELSIETPQGEIVTLQRRA